jgi:hypothetical protein
MAMSRGHLTIKQQQQLLWHFETNGAVDNRQGTPNAYYG